MTSPDSHNSKNKTTYSEGLNSARSGRLSNWKISPLFFLLLVIATLFFLSQHAAAQTAPKTILILTGSNPNHPGFSIITKTIESTLRDCSKSRIELLYELQQGLVEAPESPDGDQ